MVGPQVGGPGTELRTCLSSTDARGRRGPRGHPTRAAVQPQLAPLPSDLQQVNHRQPLTFVHKTHLNVYLQVNCLKVKQKTHMLNRFVLQRYIVNGFLLLLIGAVS